MRRRPSRMAGYRRHHGGSAGRGWMRRRVWHHAVFAEAAADRRRPAGQLGALPEAPPDEPAATFDGLEDRARQATADAAKSGADISAVVLDRNTDQIVSNGDNQPFPIASVAKLFIADDLLLQESKARRRSLPPTAARSTSCCGPPTTTRPRILEPQRRRRHHHPGGARYGLAGTTAPYNGRWDVTLSTASDLVRYYDMLLDGSGGLPPDRPTSSSATAQSTPTGIDGYPQRFGIPEGFCRAGRGQAGLDAAGSAPTSCTCPPV